MKQHTSGFKEEIKNLGRQLDSTLTFGNTTLSEELYSVTPSFEGTILKSVMKQLTIESSVDVPRETIVNYKLGLLVNGSYEYMDYGNHVVYSSEKEEDKNLYKILCFDKLLYSMVLYEGVEGTFPMTVREYLTAICNKLGITFANENATFANYNRIIPADPYIGLEYTYRDVLDELAQVTASTICMNKNDELEVRYITDTNDTIDEEYLKDVNVNFAEKYGKINSIVLSRAGESDNVYLRDEESVQENGLCELKIIDNQIMNNNDRSDYLPDILAQLNGLEYYINDFSSTGILYYDLCDRYGVKVGDKTYSCIMFNDEVNVTTGLEEFIYTDMPEQSQTDYTKADKTDRKINQTYLIVDKQNQKIESLITQIGDRSEKTTSITQDIDGINATVQDLEDLTIDGVSNTANLEMQDINQCEPIEIRIHPIIDSIYYLYPNAKLYPSNQTFLRSRILRFTRTYIDGVEEKTENIDYTLPDDLLWFDNETYDEFYLDYDKQICQVTKRCGLNADGEIYKLSNAIIKNFEYPTIQLKSGDYEIKLLNCQTGYIYAKLIRQNTFTERFATQAQLQSEIKQTSNEIRLSLNEKLDNEDFTGANIVLAINQDTSSAIINADKVSLEGKVIDMTADDIIIDSNKFSLDSKGNMSCSNANITGGDVTLKSESDSVSKLRVETDDENVYTEIRPAGVRTVYNGTILFWANAVTTAIRNRQGKTVLFAGNSIYVDDDYSSNQYPISLTGSDGNISCVTLTQTSSEKNKKDFEKLENALDIIKTTDIYKYRFKNEDENHKKHIGFVIGDNFNYSEEITNANNDEVEIYSMLSVAYKAIQEQQEEIEILKNEINNLKEMIKNGI